MAVALLAADGTIVAVNEGWRAFARSNGSAAPDGLLWSNYLTVCERVSGVEGASAHAAAQGIRAVLAGDSEFTLEYACHSPTQQRWFELRASRLEHDGAVFAIVAHQDVTKRVVAEQERQQTTERQALLIRELHHRVRNALATVQALLGASARSSRSVEEFYHSFSGRIASLAKTQTLLTEDYWQTAPFRHLLEQELQPFLDGDQRRFLLKGPHVELSADLAMPVGMAVHELAVNAVTHGALSNGTGWVEVDWDLRQVDGVRKFHLAWIEHDGPPVRMPQSTGFGSTLLERVLPSQARAEVNLKYRREGVRFEMTAPLVERRLVPEY